MDIKLFSKIVKKLCDDDLCDFEYIDSDGRIYGFKEVGDDKWDDEGKYQYKHEEGQLIELDKHYKEIQSFNFGVTRDVQRSGSYFSDYYYDYEPYEFFEINEITIPEKIIPAHTEDRWNKLNIDLASVIDEEEEKQKNIEAEKVRLEEEAKAEKERLAKLYSMKNPEIIQMVNKNFKKRGIKSFTIVDMRKEYFDIVVSNNLESQEWIDYYRNLLE